MLRVTDVLCYKQRQIATIFSTLNKCERRQFSLQILSLSKPHTVSLIAVYDTKKQVRHRYDQSRVRTPGTNIIRHTIVLAQRLSQLFK